MNVYSRVPNKRIGQITVYCGKSVKFNNSIVPNNSVRGQIVQNNIIVQCEKVTSIFVFSSAEAILFVFLTNNIPCRAPEN